MYTTPQYSKRILLMLLLFFVAIVATSVILQPISSLYPHDSRNGLLLATCIQNVVMFILPSSVTAFFITNQPIKFLGIKKGFSVKIIIGILSIMIFAIPPLNVIIDWNSNIALPESLNEIENAFREMEEAAVETTNIILKTSSLPGMLAGVMIVGLLTGFSEEIFFRGTMQRVIASNGMNHHFAIWLTAIIFSLLHFQFYGFVPRVLLGAFFGYIFFWTGSIWCSAFAHAVNNSIVVIVAYLKSIGLIDSDFEKIGVVDSGISYYVLISIVLTILSIFVFKQILLKHTSIK